MQYLEKDYQDMQYLEEDDQDVQNFEEDDNSNKLTELGKKML